VSLIDDALKRAQAAGQKDRAQPGERPWIPAPMPDPGLARRRRLLPVAGVAAVVAAAVSAAFLYFPRPGAPAPRIATGQRFGGGDSAPAAVAIAQPTAAPTVATGLAPTPAPPRPRPTRTAFPESAGGFEGETVVAPPPHAASQAPTLISGKTYAGAVTLPGGARIELGGIAWSEAEPRALLNDRIAAVGAYVEGFTVSKIEQDRVALEKAGVTIFITVK
jgi:hypothetical protein